MDAWSNFDNLTPCQEYGHDYEQDGETYSQCLTCGEEREPED
jgi:hypothetical protein